MSPLYSNRTVSHHCQRLVLAGAAAMLLIRAEQISTRLMSVRERCLLVTVLKYSKHDLTWSAVQADYSMLVQVLWVCLPVVQGVPGPRGQAPGCHHEQGQIHACWQGGQCSRVRPLLNANTALLSIIQLELPTSAMLGCCFAVAAAAFLHWSATLTW